MPKLTITYTECTQFKHAPLTREQLEKLQVLTGMNKSEIIRKAIADMLHRQRRARNEAVLHKYQERNHV